MRFSIIAVIAALTSLSTAQSLLDQLPQCARTCVGQNFGGCKTLDIACICGNSDLISNLSCCVSKSCDADDTKTTIEFAAQLCKTYNIIVPSVASCASSASATGTPSSTASGASASSVASASSASSAASESSSVAAKISSAASAATASPASATASSTGIAAVNNVGMGVGMGAAVAGLFAML
ncbi:uncharacterized protein BDZ99DRAFT_301459 [Mytilinidion resinicola]|uniref:CFEM domain-containing protein n=1 Tax=Mytilinidion resinicola TaxID=574789 RepID=A0A6A6YN92_9PEZI|nr:uncharacterized protein BDZ99DRAFT_301459 [Mytilinidion resinicola]KAF2810008.1 hypothetical protein BDZ99DRAFT_301459 [Mytilinidion resinicola]